MTFCCISLFLHFTFLFIVNVETNYDIYPIPKHVCIIGGGAAGLVSIHRCKQYGFNCLLYEQTSQLGGTWVYTSEVGIDSHGLPIHTSMYDGLRTNLPKEIMNYPDFKFKNINESYISKNQVLQYLQSYADYFELHDSIRFQHRVINVEPKGDKWLVIIENLLTSETIEEEFDAIMVCNGHFSKPSIPDLDGMEDFKGVRMHSHDFRNSKQFNEKTVIVLGAGPSGIDISHIVSKEANKVYLSHRRKEITSDVMTLKKNVKQVTNIERLTKDGAVLKDGTKIKADAIIFCTGYKYYFPFLSMHCGVTVDNNWVKPLYKHVINIEQPTMGFIGLNFQAVTFPLFDYQVMFFLNYLQGTFSLPSKEEMIEDTENEVDSKLEKGWPKKFAHRLGSDYQRKYFAELTEIAKIDPIPPVILNLYDETHGKYKRDRRFKIIDRENFIEL